MVLDIRQSVDLCARCLLLVACVVLSACGLIQDRSSEYMRADKGNDIRLPERLSQITLTSKYPIDSIENERSLPDEFVLPEPPDATAALKIEPFEIEEVDGEVWLHVFNAPNNIWPLVELFWNQFELELIDEDPRKGLLSTQKLDEQRGSQLLIRRIAEEDPNALVIEGMSFQTRTVHGVRRNTSEVQVRALLPNQIAENGTWRSDSINKRLEGTVLKLLGQFVTAEETTSRHSLLASEIGGASRVRLLEVDQGNRVLELDLSMRRAWNEVNQALDASGIVVADKDFEQRVFYVSYLNQDDLENWYHTPSMVESRSLEKNLSLTLVEENGVIKVLVELLNNELEDGEEKRILNVLYEYIS